ncbi:hypothetical protein [Arthrobacter sp. 35W]|uniref:hypothetical protein n=1 Tax=Arthrobacter sp. 35W TaxID=1132441 RepID=UPI00040EAE4F|nr:hypothetical protein [Arthrobacter sp. 35W]
MNWYETNSGFAPSRDDLGWLISRNGDDLRGFTGIDASGWEDSTWILNAFYELPSKGPVPTHDELHKSRIGSGDEEPLIINGVNLDEMTTATGGGLGYEKRPPVDWQRRTWAEMLVRFPHPRPADGPPPCYRWFPATDFPANIELPTEGSMSEEDFTELINVLSRRTPAAACSMYFAGLTSTFPDSPENPVYDASLLNLPPLLREASEDGQVFTPSNIWPSDRSWLVYTDYDLWATKVSGSTELINELRMNPLLETFDWAPAGSANRTT